MVKRPALIRLTASLLLATAALVGVAVAFAPARAQVVDPARGDLPAPGEGFAWERVGDIPIDASDLAFGPDTTLWATGARSPYRLDLSGGFPGTWVATNGVGDAILPLGRGSQGDTLLVVTAGSVRRSLDGGQSWVHVRNRGGGGIYEISEDYPYAGRVLVSATDGHAGSIAYSDDRGATFTEAVVPGPGGNYGDGRDFVALPPDSPYAGRILAAGRWGVNVSDDGGETFRESGLWQVLRYLGFAIDVTEGLAAGEAPGGGVAGVVAGLVNGVSSARAWASADGGEAWAPEDGLALEEGPPNDGSARAVLAVGASSALVVLRGGTVYRTDDAGQSWEPVGRAPEISTAITLRSAALGPDDRLYVGLVQSGVEDAWVYRTAERLTLPPVGVTLTTTSPSRLLTVPPGGGTLPLRVTLTNPADEAQTVTAGTAVRLPDGTPYGPLLTRSVTLPAGASVTAALTQHVPASAPAGRYRYVAFVGEWPDGVRASDELAFVKQAPARGTGARTAGSESWSAEVVWAEEGEPPPVASAALGAEAEGLNVSVSPNPFRGAATLTLSLPQPAEVDVALYDVLGRRAAVLHAGLLGAGEHAVALDVSRLPAGVYVVRVSAGGAVRTGRVTLVR